MKVEIINKPMLCWDNDENEAKEYHVLAKLIEPQIDYSYKVICNENTYPEHSNWNADLAGGGWGFKHAKSLPETIELTVAEISKILGKTVKIIE